MPKGIYVFGGSDAAALQGLFMIPHMIPYGRQSVSEEDIQAVVRVLKSDWLTQGPEVESFEAALAAYCGASHAVAVSSATAALHLACLAVGLGPDDILWTSPNTFVASANCALYCGAKIGFIDIDPATGNMDVIKLESALERARSKGSLPKVLVPVHFAGQPCVMETIHALSRRFGFLIVEDASHALGAEYRGGKVGSCLHSHMTVFSFHPVKIATSGEGGAILTSDLGLRSRLVSLRSHGITRDTSAMERPSPGPWYYEQQELGFNFRMCDIQAALGRSQLGRVDAFVARRRELAARYDKLLSGLPVKPLEQSADSRSSYHLYVVRIDAAATRKSQPWILAALRAAGIAATLHYPAVHLQPYYMRLGFRAGDFPEAEAYAGEAVTLPLFYGLSDADQDHIVAELGNAFAT